MDNKEKILKKLFEKPEYKFHIRELARETKLNPNTIINLTKELVKEKIIIKKRNKNIVEIYCDLDSKNYKRKKQLYNISSINNSGLLDYLVDFYNHPQAIILFGSFLRGEDFSGGDIDIAVISTNKKESDLIKFEKKLKRKIHLLSFTYKEISDEFYTNLINGFVLYGYLKYERV